MDNKYQLELQQALADFTAKVEKAKGDYNKKIDDILQKIDALKIAQVKKKLNI
mgnify:FL=1